LLAQHDSPIARNLEFQAHFFHFAAIRLFLKWKAFEKVPTGEGAAICIPCVLEDLPEVIEEARQHNDKLRDGAD
jgi:hypothetical protein